MAKYTRTRKYSRRKGGKWSSNLERIREVYNAVPAGEHGNTITIAQNPGQSNINVSQIFTVKNIEVSAQLEAASSGNPNNVENIEYYILYVPEGYPIGIDIPDKHSEWIMAYKFIGSAISQAEVTTSNAQVPRIRTRLARKLNSGDSVIFLYRFINKNSSGNVDIKCNGLIRWWTKAN